MNLQLSLKQKWFEMTASGEKPEDYREITPYWCARLLLYDNNRRSQAFWRTYLHACNLQLASPNDITNGVSLRQFKTNTLTLGYPKATDTDKILKYKHAGIEIRTGNPEWGAEKDKLYFVIKHGKRLWK